MLKHAIAALAVLATGALPICPASAATQVDGALSRAVVIEPESRSGHPTLPATDPLRVWTLEDIVQSPVVNSVALTEDGRHALVVVRQGRLMVNAKRSSLRVVDLQAGSERDILSSTWISHVQPIPGSTDWSLLTDQGDGVQVYQTDLQGKLSPLIVSATTDDIGSPTEGRQAFGVTDYGWSQDGASLFYLRREPSPEAGRVLNPQFANPPSYESGPMELRIRTGDGEDFSVARLEAGQGRLFGVTWEESTGCLTYSAASLNGRSFTSYRWDRKTRAVERVGGSQTTIAGDRTGLEGGTFTVIGVGDGRRLVEAIPEGLNIDYGPFEGRIQNDPRFSETFTSKAHGVALIGFGEDGLSQYGLLRLRLRGAVERIGASGTLTNCAVTPSFSTGVCIQQSMTAPPTLVRFDPLAGGVTPVLSLSPEYEAITPLTVMPRLWTNRSGFKAKGFVVYPRGYREGEVYPAIVVTHGSDADNTFVNQALQWEYPVQALAERGYVVVAINEPWPAQSEELQAAYSQWTGTGTLPPERIQDLIWINTVLTIEDAVKDLAAEGLVDAQRVGIAGYSFGSQLVNVAMTQSRLFRAASSGDGGYLEPAGYFWLSETYRQVYGGSPFDPNAIAQYQRFSPTFRAANASGPVLQQVAMGSAPQIMMHVALRDAGVPSELSYYRSESHLFHQPLNRVEAMRENIAWFDFWLRDLSESEFITPEQALRWEGMRSVWRARPAAVIEPSEISQPVAQ